MIKLKNPLLLATTMTNDKKHFINYYLIYKFDASKSKLL